MSKAMSIKQAEHDKADANIQVIEVATMTLLDCSEKCTYMLQRCSDTNADLPRQVSTPPKLAQAFVG